MNQNQMNMMGTYQMPQAKSKGFGLPENGKPIFIAFLILLAVLVVGLFLPYLTREFDNFSMNYIYEADQVRDGIFILGFTVASLLLALSRKYIGSVIFQVLSLGIFIYDWINTLDLMKESNNLGSALGDAYVYKLGIGFYITFIALIGSLITIIIVWIQNKNAKAPVAQNPMYNAVPTAQPMNQAVLNQVPVQPQPQAPVNNTCPYCGSPKTPGAPFCPNCGAK